MKTYADLESRSSLIMPRLEAIRNQGGSSWIHRVSRMMNGIINWMFLFKVYEEKESEKDMNRCYDQCVKYMEEAEEWLKAIARNL